MSKPVLIISDERLISLFMSLFGVSSLPKEFLRPSPVVVDVIRALVSHRLDELSRVLDHETDRA